MSDTKIMVALNPYVKDLDLREMVAIGDMIEANQHGAEFNLTPGRQYELSGYDGDCIQVMNDLGVKDWYSRDYFRKVY